jgi:hypothetical protein
MCESDFWTRGELRRLTMPRAPVAAEVHHAVGVRGGAALGDRDQEHVVHGLVAHESDQLGAGVGLDGQAARGAQGGQGAPEQPGHGHGGHGGGALAHADDALQRAGRVPDALHQGRAAPESLGQELHRALFLEIFAVQGVAHGVGGLVDLLLDVVRVLAPEDVAGENLDLLLGQGHGLAVVQVAGHRHRTVRVRVLEDHGHAAELVHGHGIGGTGAGGHAVGLGGHQPAVVDAADVEGLPGPLLGQELGIEVAQVLHDHGQGTLAPLEHAAEPLLGAAGVLHAQVEEHGQDLGVRGDDGGNVRALGDDRFLHQGAVVVHVAVQDEHGLFQPGGHVALHQPVHGVAVGHGDDAVARPAGVGDDVQGGQPLGHGPEQLVVGDEFAQGGTVVAQLAHQLRHLVEEAAGGAAVGQLADQHLAGVGVADGAAVAQLRFLVRAQSQLGIAPLGQDKGHGHAGGIAAPDLQLVDGLEDHLRAPGQEVAVAGRGVPGQGRGHQPESAVRVDQHLLLDLPQVVVQGLAKPLQLVGARPLFQLDRCGVAQGADGVAQGFQRLAGGGVGHQLHVQAEGHEVVEAGGQVGQGGGGPEQVRGVADIGEGRFKGEEPGAVRRLQPFFIA